ncbi:PP2C family protein-serine/threonine phosphatase [Aestuariivivens sediminis]|uniref:PP2C family protein-serine/threonine phosphatase n=1 Tax=Aestuariivivens sediminis TaxID=2913557 RepID=UPI001F55F52A|nr:PP2C family serine/threonine-protein phosphatase [Aestuariivivens sediminis]
MKYSTFSHKGSRSVNEDKIHIESLKNYSELFLIADGMGGYEDGENAASMIVESISTYLNTLKEIIPKDIQKAINKANLAIRQYQQIAGYKSGATLAGSIVMIDKIICFWVGDVKIFHFRNNKLIKESKPHSLVNELIQINSYVEPERIKNIKHVVTRSIQGDLKKSEMDYFEVINPEKDDVLIICSDGVHDKLNGLQIERMLSNSDFIDKNVLAIEDVLHDVAKDNYSLIAITNF